MARFDRLTVYSTMLADGMVPLFYNGDIATVQAATGAIARGGSHLLEFTNRGDFALEVFSQLVKWAAEAHPGLVIGVGSVEDAPTAALYLAHGANFVVGPNFNPEVARLCNRRKVAYLPGCGSATEIAEAEEAGVEIVKLFPWQRVRPGVRQGRARPAPLDAHHAHQRRQPGRGQPAWLVRGGRGLRRDGRPTGARRLAQGRGIRQDRAARRRNPGDHPHHSRLMRGVAV